MNRLDAFYDTTLTLHELLNKDIPQEDREETIEQMNELLDKRSNQLTAITPPFSEDEKEVGKKLVTLNKTIEEKMHELLNQVKVDVRTVKKQKNTNNKYTNPYKNLSSFDGMFLDHKK